MTPFLALQKFVRLQKFVTYLLTHLFTAPGPTRGHTTTQRVPGENLDPGVDVLPSLVERRQLQFDGLIVPAAAIDQFHGQVTQLINPRRQTTPFRHQLLHKRTSQLLITQRDKR